MTRTAVPASASASALALVTIVSLGCGGCGGGDGDADARPADADDADADPDGCSGAQAFTGELIDFASTDETFLGVFDAVFTLRDEPTCTGTTAPNGRFVLEAPDDHFTVFDVDAPDDYLDGIWPVGSGFAASPSGRALTAADLAGLDVTLDPTRAQVMLSQSNLNPLPLTISGTQDETFTTQDGAVWTPGNDLRYVLYTNVEIGSGTQTLTDAQAVTETLGELVVEAGKVSYITTVQLPE